MRAALRHATVGVRVGEGDGTVTVGGGAPIVVQSMTNTDTADIEATTRQIAALARAGSELVRLTVDREEAAAAVPHIRDRLRAQRDHGAADRRLSLHRPQAAGRASGLRRSARQISHQSRQCRLQEQARPAIRQDRRDCHPQRQDGAHRRNWGSLDQDLLTTLMDENAASAEPLEAGVVTREAMVRSALLSAARAEEIGLKRERIILSAKVSSVQDLITVYRMLGRRSDYALHLGLTEAGMGSKGIVASSAALGILLQEGLGDTTAFRSPPSRAATGRRRSRSRRNCCRPWGSAVSRRRSPLAPAAGARPRPCSRNGRVTSRPILCAVYAGMGGGLSGRRAAERRGDGLHCQRPWREQDANIGIFCREPAKRRRRRCSSTGLRRSRFAGRASPRTSRRWSTTISRSGTGRTGRRRNKERELYVDRI